MKRRLITALLALTLALPLSAPALASQIGGRLLPAIRSGSGFPDTDGTVWAEAVEPVYETGLMDGWYQGDFRPHDSMTNAQAVAVASRLHARLTGDGYISLIYDDAPWWVGYYQYFRRAIEGSGLDMPIYLREDVMARMAGEPCTREEFVRLTTYALELSGVTLPEINQVVLPDVLPGNYTETLEPCIYRFYNAGILTGGDRYGAFHGKRAVIRGEAAMILSRIVDPEKRVPLSLDTFDLCRDVLDTEPETTALTAGETVITMEQAAQTLGMALRQEGWEALDGDIPRDDLTQGLNIAVEELADDAAIGVLADREGLSWTAAELEAIYGPIPGDGCYGLTWEGWLWAYSHSYLRQRLLERYAVRYRNDAEVHLEAALNEVRSEMTVTRSAALENLDLASIQQRLLRASL